MSGFASRDDVPPSPRFRLVEAPTPDETASEAAPERSGVAAMIGEKLLVDPAAWQERRAEAPALDAVTLRVEVPLVASLARIRSEADAALALTGVLELVARRFHVKLPCAGLDGHVFCCDAPEGTLPEAVAAAADESLLSVVRATDLQGALRDQYMARVETIDAQDVA